jgi:hypothetical protein
LNKTIPGASPIRDVTYRAAEPDHSPAVDVFNKVRECPGISVVGGSV